MKLASLLFFALLFHVHQVCSPYEALDWPLSAFREGVCALGLRVVRRAPCPARPSFEAPAFYSSAPCAGSGESERMVQFPWIP
jgi:hypothetical protein